MGPADMERERPSWQLLDNKNYRIAAGLASSWKTGRT
jgi:hypothetical protein